MRFSKVKIMQRSLQKFIYALGALAVLTLSVTVQRLDANRVVLADVDCVVQPSIVADLGVPSPGILKKLYFDRADFVSGGEILAELDSDLERASLALARHLAGSTAAVELRQENAGFSDRTLQRNQSLFEKATISDQTLDQVTTEVNIAKLQVEQEQDNAKAAQLEAARAQAALNRRFVTSPFDGAITERFKSEGEYVADEAVFQIAKLDPLRIEVVILVDYLETIEVGMKAAVTLKLRGFEDQTLYATVRRIDPVADAASGTYGVWLELANPELTIPSGVRCQLDFLAA